MGEWEPLKKHHKAIVRHKEVVWIVFMKLGNSREDGNKIK
jgi:hypothetical protein